MTLSSDDNTITSPSSSDKDSEDSKSDTLTELERDQHGKGGNQARWRSLKSPRRPRRHLRIIIPISKAHQPMETCHDLLHLLLMNIFCCLKLISMSASTQNTVLIKADKFWEYIACQYEEIVHKAAVWSKQVLNA
jgi:hypothetical protein